MSEFKGTPGPFRVHVSDDGFPSVLAAGNFVVAGVDGIANAHLLAASWDLLHFAIDQRKKLHCVCRLNEIVAPLGAGIECTACRLDALLAKAFNTDGKLGVTA